LAQIYLPCGNATKVIHRIRRPNNEGDECAFERNIEIPTLNYVTLPNFPNYRLGPLDGSGCDTLGLNNNPVAWWRYEPNPIWLPELEFFDLSYHEPATWHWDFGDGTTSEEQNPVHLFLYSDTFQVCLTVTNIHGSNTYCKPIVITGISGATDGPSVADGGARVAVSPNPANTSITVTLHNFEKREGILSVLDVNGALVAAQNLTGTKTLSISTETWHSGMYLMVLIDEHGRFVGTSRFIVQH
jgi:hypothetical protein